MTSSIKVLVFSLFILSLEFSYSQAENNCEVIIENLKGQYSGDCKDGLANGKGVLKYSEGDKNFMFIGHFKKGKMHGDGQLFALLELEQKLLKEGIWKKNIYKGEKKDMSQAYRIKRKMNIDRYSVRKISDEKNSISFKFLQNGQTNSVDQLRIVGDSGVRRGDSFSTYDNGYDDMQFPFTCKVSYRTQNKMRSTSYDVEFEIIINEPGLWQVTLNN